MTNTKPELPYWSIELEHDFVKLSEADVGCPHDWPRDDNGNPRAVKWDIACVCSPLDSQYPEDAIVLHFLNYVDIDPQSIHTVEYVAS